MAYTWSRPGWADVATVEAMMAEFLARVQGPDASSGMLAPEAVRGSQ